MKTLLLASLLLAAPATTFAADPPEIPYTADANFLKLPDNMHFGETSGVAVNSKKHVFVFQRANTNGPAFGASAAQLLEFDQTGKFVREIGKGLYAWAYAHDVRVDKDDNVWVYDRPNDLTSLELGAEQTPPLSDCCVRPPSMIHIAGHDGPGYKEGEVIEFFDGSGL